MEIGFKIISGGQTGVDRAALDVALALNIPCGGWCPKGRLAEDGRIDEKYPLQETPLEDYAQRTEWNVRDSDGSLIIMLEAPMGGTKKAIDFCAKYNKPFLQVDLSRNEDPKLVIEWIQKKHIKVLGIGGPRLSEAPGVYEVSKNFLRNIFSEFSV